MILSTLLRSSACTNSIFRQQVMKMATQQTLQRPTCIIPLSTVAFKGVSSNSTPIYNSVRSFRTSPVSLSGNKPHDHSKLWVIEKGVAALLVPLLPMGLLIPNKIFDSLIAILICAHSFWGLEAIAIDYVRASVVGPILPKIALALVYLLSIATLGGLFYIIGHEGGLANIIKQIWSIKAQQS